MELNLSFIAFGSTNFYSEYILKDVNNKFYVFPNGNQKFNKVSKNLFTIDDTYDYGLILKFQHTNFPNRTWILIAGIGEAGTSGAGWYLSNH